MDEYPCSINWWTNANTVNRISFFRSEFGVKLLDRYFMNKVDGDDEELLNWLKWNQLFFQNTIVAYVTFQLRWVQLFKNFLKMISKSERHHHDWCYIEYIPELRDTLTNHCFFQSRHVQSRTMYGQVVSYRGVVRVNGEESEIVDIKKKSKSEIVTTA